MTTEKNANAACLQAEAGKRPAQAAGRDRLALLTRDTAETKIRLTLNLDGSGKYRIETGCGF